MATSRPLQAKNLSESIASQADSLAKTSATPEADEDYLEIAAASGMNLRASFAWWDRDTCSWKTSQQSFLEDSMQFSEPWPIAGTMRNGLVSPRAQWVHHTCDEGCSLWPTPTASMDGRGFGIPLYANNRGRYRESTVQRVRELVGQHGWKIHPNFTEALMGFPLEWSAIDPLEIP